MANWSWVRTHRWSGVDIEGHHDHQGSQDGQDKTAGNEKTAADSHGDGDPDRTAAAGQIIAPDIRIIILQGLE